MISNHKINLASPLLIISIAVLLVNDIFFKHSGLLPPVITGKLSDFAFLFFVPIIFCFILRFNSKKKALIVYCIVGVIFTVLNIFSFLSNKTVSIVSEFYTIELWPDLTDLIALSVMPFSYIYMFRNLLERSEKRRYLKYAVLIVSLFGIINTSRADSHKPVYMDKNEFRKVSFEVRAPKPIEKRGKIITYKNYIILSEPLRGIHIIDNKNKNKPKQIAFIFILGNMDAVVEDDVLYADCLTDLLAIDISDERNIRLLRRENDILVYNPFVLLPKGSYVRYWNAANEYGENKIIIGWDER